MSDVDKKRSRNRELAWGLWRAVRQEWSAFALLCIGIGCYAWLGQYALAASQLLIVVVFAFAIFFKNEARDGWEAASEVLGQLEAVLDELERQEKSHKPAPWKETRT